MLQPHHRLRLRVETFSRRPGSDETVEALLTDVDDDTGLARLTDAGGRERVCLVRGVTVAIDTTETLLCGRRSHAAIRLGLVSASNRHVVMGGDPLRLEDPGSTNGTFVNGEFLSGRTLQHGDIVHFEGHRDGTRLLCRMLLEERPLIDGARRVDDWVILAGATTVPGCHHRAFRRVDEETIETGTAVATGPAELFATPMRLEPVTGFRITADGASIPAIRLLTMLRTGHADDALAAALALEPDTIDIDGRCFRWTADQGVLLPMSRVERDAVATAVNGLLPRLAEQHRALVAELELLGADDIDAIARFAPSAPA